MTMGRVGAGLRRLLRRFAEEDDGWAGTVIAYPAVIIFCLALFQFGFYYVAGNNAQAVAWNSYQQARAYHATTSDSQTAADAALATAGNVLQHGRVTVTRTPTTVTVEVTGDALTILPGLPLPQVARTLTGPVERWVPTP